MEFNIFKETEKRYIDDENDIYPTPLVTSFPSEKVEGLSKLYYAIIYFRIGRIRQLLRVFQNNNESDIDIVNGFGDNENLIHIISQSMHETNIHYFGHENLYDNLFFCVLNNLTDENLNELFKQLIKKETYWKKSMISEILNELSDRNHMLLALWNYGLIYSKEDIKEYPNKSIVSIFNKFIDEKYIPKKRYLLLNQICPITCQIINIIAILSDGTAYEYSAIKEHLLNKDTNPLTNEILLCKSKTGFWNNETKKFENINISTKILYLPENSKFEYFDLLKKY